MSKIYEALQRAERDRLSEKKASSGTEAEQSTKTSAPNLKEQFLLAQSFSAQSLGAQAEAGFPHLSLGPMPRTVDLAEIQPHTWNPSFSQLPALQERGGAVEQFRSLRSRMQEFRDLSQIKAILISSGLPLEGKSFVAANLAISLARHNSSRVLLIDGDMRRCTLHQLLGAPQRPGLTEYLSGKATLSEILQRSAPSTTTEPLAASLASLTFISGGGDNDKAADLAGNRRFDELIAAVSPLFDWIIVDSSPVTLVSDAVNLARACDGVLLIARSGVTKFEIAQRALVELKASKILGVVLNAVKNPPSAGGYYGYETYVGTLEKPTR